MRMRALITLALGAAAPLALGGCASDYYGSGYGYNNDYYGNWNNYPYDVWYDGYYGPFYDGYWGSDGFFWFRMFQNDRTWRRGDRYHFHRGDWDRDRDGDRDRGDRNRHWQRYNGTLHQPPPNARMPNLPGWNGNRNTNRNPPKR